MGSCGTKGYSSLQTKAVQILKTHRTQTTQPNAMARGEN